MSALNIAEKRLPQDGRITQKIAGKSFDIRVSDHPDEPRLRADRHASSQQVDRAARPAGPRLRRRDYALMDSLIHRPDGIILVTGPTGSGKTTTLYACLNRINQPDINILTAEDPVEYELAQIHQVHVNAKIGLTFASALRAFLRQDPDVVMVGEIRDKETVEIAINASLTGHLVLSTLHTNDAAGAFTRMVDMGVEPFLLRSSVIGVLAQRLVRVLCPHCKEGVRGDAGDLEELGITPDALRSRVRAADAAELALLPAHASPSADPLEDVPGPATSRSSSRRAATTCAHTGFTGRRGIYELLMMDDVVGPLVLKGADAQTVKRAHDGAGNGQPARRRRAEGARRAPRASRRFSSPRKTTCEAEHRPPRRAGCDGAVHRWPSSSTRGLAVACGKQVLRRSRTRTTPKVLRAAPEARGHPPHRAPGGEARARGAGDRSTSVRFSAACSVGDAAMMTRQLRHARHRGHPAGRGGRAPSPSRSKRS